MYIISSVLILAALFIFIKSSRYHFNYTSDIYSISFDYLSSSNEMKNKVITDRNKIDKVVDFLNSLTLKKESEQPEDAVNHVNFKDEKGNTIYYFEFGGSGVLWIDSKTYNFGSSNISTLKRLLDVTD